MKPLAGGLHEAQKESWGEEEELGRLEWRRSEAKNTHIINVTGRQEASESFE